MARAETDPTDDLPPKTGPSNWLSIVKDLVPRWCDRLGSSSEAADAIYGLLRDPETRSAKHRVDASGKEIPDTSEYLDAGFWPDRLSLKPDPDGGDDHLAVDFSEYEDIYWDDYSPGWRWEGYVRALDIARWERLYPELAAPPPAPTEERKPTPKKKRRKAKLARRAGAPEQHDWEEGKLFVMQELETRGNPLDKNNQIKGWKTISDVAKLVRDHLGKLSKDGVRPDMSTTRGKVPAWIEEFERGRN